MEAKIIVMIVMLSLPNGNNSVSVKPMASAGACRVQAQIEASDPFVAAVECSELSDGRLELKFKPVENSQKSPQALIEGSTG